MLRRPALAVLGVLVAVGGAAACSSSSAGPKVAGAPAATGPDVSDASAAPSTAAANCPPPAASTAQWPLAVPADLPKPPGAAISATSVQGMVTVVRFTTPTSLRESVQFLLTELPKAGYPLGHGDVEQSEAEAPFSGPRHAGQWRMSVTGPCSTSWVLAVQARAGSSTAPLTPTLVPGAIDPDAVSSTPSPAS